MKWKKAFHFLAAIFMLTGVFSAEALSASAADKKTGYVSVAK